MPVHNNDPNEALRQHTLSSQSQSSASSPHASEVLRQQEAKRADETKHAEPVSKSKKAHEIDDGNKLDAAKKSEAWKNFSASHVPPSAPPLQSQSAGSATPIEGAKSTTAAQLRRDLERNVKA